ncbi:hypothetical protein AAES_128408 [Amazona aestiva]|uniref:Uncharacterized protein n=1 Tax=Amazona aestiva TaxID=12930 RepID=A0A0Q3M3D1_AMAAE|nr:hypothetical protein AAES_128408 [Amazona aestiva]
MFWGLAYAYTALLNIVQHLQGEKEFSGSDGTATNNTVTQSPSTAATPNLTTDSAATPTTVKDTATTPTPVKDIEAKSKDQFVPVSVAPISKEKSKQDPQRAIQSVKKDEDPMHVLEGMASEPQLLLQESEEE